MNPIITLMLTRLRQADIKVQAGAPASACTPHYERLAVLSRQIRALEAAGFAVVDMEFGSDAPVFTVREADRAHAQEQ